MTSFFIPNAKPQSTNILKQIITAISSFSQGCKFISACNCGAQSLTEDRAVKAAQVSHKALA